MNADKSDKKIFYPRSSETTNSLGSFMSVTSTGVDERDFRVALRLGERAVRDALLASSAHARAIYGEPKAINAADRAVFRQSVPWRKEEGFATRH
jgi:hypothetical protein